MTEVVDAPGTVRDVMCSSAAFFTWSLIGLIVHRVDGRVSDFTSSASMETLHEEVSCRRRRMSSLALVLRPYLAVVLRLMA